MVTRKANAPAQIVKPKRVAKKTAFPAKPRRSALPVTMSQSQKKRVSGASSHRERVLMRATIRKAGVVSRDAPNDAADQWLMSHGWLNSKGYKAPHDRVKRLAKSVGFKRMPTVKQLGLQQ